MNRMFLTTIGAVCLGVVGCASTQLKHSTVSQASSLTNLQYQQVLDNLAMMYGNTSALPWHVNLTTGTAQVTDFGSANLTMAFGRSMGHLATYSPTLSAQRTIVETWGTVPVTDDDNLRLLRMAYHDAMGYGEYLENSPEYANDLGHELAKQTAVSLDPTQLASFRSEQTKEKSEEIRGPFIDQSSGGMLEPSPGPVVYRLVDKATVTPSDRCLECDLKNKITHKILIESYDGSEYDVATGKKFRFNHENNRSGLTISKGDSIIWQNNDDIPHTAKVPMPGSSSFETRSISPRGPCDPVTFSVASGPQGFSYYDETGQIAGTIKVVENGDCEPVSPRTRVHRILFNGTRLDNMILQKAHSFLTTEDIANKSYIGKEYFVVSDPTEVDSDDIVAWVNTGLYPVRISTLSEKTGQWTYLQQFLATGRGSSEGDRELNVSRVFLFPQAGLIERFYYRIEELIPKDLSEIHPPPEPSSKPSSHQPVTAPFSGVPVIPSTEALASPSASKAVSNLVPTAAKIDAAYKVGRTIQGSVKILAQKTKSPEVKEVCRQLVDINDELKKIPTNWFHVGAKKEVPWHRACFVGHYGDRYVWVCPEGREGLSQFTLSVLKLSTTIKERQVVTSPGVQYSPGFSMSPR